MDVKKCSQIKVVFRNPEHDPDAPDFMKGLKAFLEANNWNWKSKNLNQDQKKFLQKSINTIQYLSNKGLFYKDSERVIESLKSYIVRKFKDSNAFKNACEENIKACEENIKESKDSEAFKKVREEIIKKFIDSIIDSINFFIDSIIQYADHQNHLNHRKINWFGVLNKTKSIQHLEEYLQLKGDNETFDAFEIESVISYVPKAVLKNFSPCKVQKAKKKVVNDKIIPKEHSRQSTEESSIEVPRSGLEDINNRFDFNDAGPRDEILHQNGIDKEELKKIEFEVEDEPDVASKSVEIFTSSEFENYSQSEFEVVSEIDSPNKTKTQVICFPECYPEEFRSAKEGLQLLQLYESEKIIKTRKTPLKIRKTLFDYQFEKSPKTFQKFANQYLPLLKNKGELQNMMEIQDKSSTYYSLLHYAVMCKDNEMVKFLLENHAETDSSGPNRESALHLAVENGELAIVKQLVEYSKVAINYIDKDLKTPLHIACGKDYTDIVRYLVSVIDDDGDAIFTPGPKDKHGVTPLHLACENGNFEIVKILCSFKDLAVLEPLDILSQDEKAATAIMVAENNGFKDISEFLRKVSENNEPYRYETNRECEAS